MPRKVKAPEKVSDEETAETERLSVPSYTNEGRENELINMAYNLAEQRIREGTASDTMLTHFLKMGSRQSRVDIEIQELQKELIAAKTEAMKSAKRAEERFAAAMEAMKRYGGDEPL